jgi:tRNA pseudouridine65 synthase
MALEVLFQDSDYIAVHKPAGLLVHRTDLDSAETEAALQILRNQIREKIYPVHRLDRPTSGVLIFALNPEAAQSLSQLFMEKKVQKKYHAVVRGHFKKEIFLDYPLLHEITHSANPKFQEAQTHFLPISTTEVPFPVDRYPSSRYSFIEARPLTGRSHQIRRHLKHLNHPILGDVNHGNGKHNRFLKHVLQVKKMLLACRELSFPHPRTGETICIQAKLCSDFEKALQQLGLNSR